MPRSVPRPAEIRDDLCLYLTTLPEKNSDFLRTTVESCLNEIVKTMSGQFITHNKENDQYYLDLEKNVDYDTEIERRSESLSQERIGPLLLRRTQTSDGVCGST